MTPEKARDMGRWTKALSDEYAGLEMTAQANTMRRESEGWLAYALTLEATSRNADQGRLSSRAVEPKIQDQGLVADRVTDCSRLQIVVPCLE
jgi:hypothetical protein